jgi:peptide/nickel transport system permease protein
VGQIGPTIIFATLPVFLLLQLVPGDVALVIAGENATPERLQEIREQLFLDQPLLVQYAHWLWHAVHGNLGVSLISGFPVLGLVWSHFVVTAQLIVEAVGLATLVGLPLGILMALKRDRPVGTLLRGISVIGLSIPSFVVAMILAAVFALSLRWLPATGFASWFDNPGAAARYTLLPAVALSLIGISEIARQTASELTSVLGRDCIRTHVGKGLTQLTILRHAIRNAGVLILTIVTLLVNRFLGATVVIETIFAIPGAGRLVVGSVNQRDYPVVQGVVLIMVVVVMIVNIIGDIAYRLIDPRIRL